MALRAEIMAVGTPAPLARMLGSQQPSAMNAGGVDQTSAPELTRNFVEVTVGGSGTGVRLKPANGQYLNVIYCSPASLSSCNIWPAVGEEICFGGVNNPFALPVGMVAILLPAGTEWGGGSMWGPAGPITTMPGTIVLGSPNPVPPPQTAGLVAGQLASRPDPVGGTELVARLGLNEYIDATGTFRYLGNGPAGVLLTRDYDQNNMPGGPSRIALGVADSNSAGPGALVNNTGNLQLVFGPRGGAAAPFVFLGDGTEIPAHLARRGAMLVRSLSVAADQISPGTDFAARVALNAFVGNDNNWYYRSQGAAATLVTHDNVGAGPARVTLQAYPSGTAAEQAMTTPGLGGWHVVYVPPNDQANFVVIGPSTDIPPALAHEGSVLCRQLSIAPDPLALDQFDQSARVTMNLFIGADGNWYYRGNGTGAKASTHSLLAGVPTPAYLAMTVEDIGTANAMLNPTNDALLLVHGPRGTAAPFVMAADRSALGPIIGSALPPQGSVLASQLSLAPNVLGDNDDSARLVLNGYIDSTLTYRYRGNGPGAALVTHDQGGPPRLTLTMWDVNTAGPAAPVSGGQSLFNGVYGAPGAGASFLVMGPPTEIPVALARARAILTRGLSIAADPLTGGADNSARIGLNAFLGADGNYRYRVPGAAATIQTHDGGSGPAIPARLTIGIYDVGAAAEQGLSQTNDSLGPLHLVYGTAGSPNPFVVLGPSTAIPAGPSANLPTNGVLVAAAGLTTGADNLAGENQSRLGLNMFRAASGQTYYVGAGTGLMLLTRDTFGMPRAQVLIGDTGTAGAAAASLTAANFFFGQSGQPGAPFLQVGPGTDVTGLGASVLPRMGDLWSRGLSAQADPTAAGADNSARLGLNAHLANSDGNWHLRAAGAAAMITTHDGGSSPVQPRLSFRVTDEGVAGAPASWGWSSHHVFGARGGGGAPYLVVGAPSDIPPVGFDARQKSLLAYQLALEPDNLGGSDNVCRLGMNAYIDQGGTWRYLQNGGAAILAEHDLAGTWPANRLQLSLIANNLGGAAAAMAIPADGIVFGQGNIRVGQPDNSPWAPSGSMIIKQNTTLAATPALPGTSRATLLECLGADNIEPSVLVTAFIGSTAGLGGRYAFRAARGTGGAPAALQSGDVLGALEWHGYGAGQWDASAGGMAQLSCQAVENWTNSAQGTQIIFGATPAGSIARATVCQLLSPAADTQTGMLIAVNRTGTVSLSQVTTGAANSGGTGFRQLLVAN